MMVLWPSLVVSWTGVTVNAFDVLPVSDSAGMVTVTLVGPVWV